MLGCCAMTFDMHGTSAGLKSEMSAQDYMCHVSLDNFASSLEATLSFQYTYRKKNSNKHLQLSFFFIVKKINKVDLGVLGEQNVCIKTFESRICVNPCTSSFL